MTYWIIAQLSWLTELLHKYHALLNYFTNTMPYWIIAYISCLTELLHKYNALLNYYTNTIPYWFITQIQCLNELLHKYHALLNYCTNTMPYWITGENITNILIYLYRCPNYPALPPYCNLVTDPSDPCCEIPKCLQPNATNPNQVVTGSKGTIIGQPQPNNPFTGRSSKFYTVCMSVFKPLCICSAAVPFI